MKKITSIILAFMLLIINIPFTVDATPLDDSKVQFNQVSDELKQLDTTLATTKREIHKLKETVSNNEESIKTTQKEIDNTQSKIDSLNEDIKKNEAVLDERLREMYKNDSYSEFNYLSFLFKSQSLTDFFNKVTACKIIINQDKKLIDDIHEKVNEQNKSMESINKQKENLVALTEDNKKKLEEVKTKEASLSETRDKLASERSRLGDLIRQNEENLIKHSLSVINDSSDYNSVDSAINTLNSLLKQISTDSVKSEANNAIVRGNKKLQTLPPPSQKDNFDGSTAPSSYKKSYTMEATAYTGDNFSALGPKPVRIPNGLSTVAVDPGVIPLGSKVYVSGYGYAIASDTGGDIKGMRIDLFMNSESECLSFGRRNVNVLVVAYEGEW
jgi:3D (Asp-Asp-Asp) domain-containing protein/peptidoglycan hydrolase CwlO-like protein